jgi:phenylacetate-CoA ligase
MKLALSRKNIWERLPTPMKAVAGLLSHVIPLKYVIGTNFRRTLQFVKDAEWWSAEEKRRYELK